jgi:hypothetical protein
METWPTTLPACTPAFSQKVKTAFYRMQTETGLSRQRPKQIENKRTQSVTWEFDEEQFADFQAFFQDTIANGTAWFNMTLPVSGYMESKVVRFVGGTYDAKHIGILYATVSATLETRDQCEAYNAEEIEAIVDAGGLIALEAAVARLYAVELEAEIIPA